MKMKTGTIGRVGRTESSSDFFTRLCESELGVKCIREYRFHPERKWRFDYAVPDSRVALEVEGGVWTGGRHTSPKGFLGDMEKYNAAALMGWKVLRTVPQDLCTRRTLDMLKAAASFRNDAGSAFFLPNK